MHERFECENARKACSNGSKFWLWHSLSFLNYRSPGIDHTSTKKLGFILAPMQQVAAFSVELTRKSMDAKKS